MQDASRPNLNVVSGTLAAANARRADHGALGANGPLASPAGHPRRLLLVLVAVEQTVLAR